LAGIRRLRRRYRGIPVAVAMVVVLAFGLTASAALDPPDPASAGTATDISVGLQSFAQSLTGLSGLNELGQSLPFTTVRPDDASGLSFTRAFTDIKTTLAAHTFTSLTDLETQLAAGLSHTYPDGVTVASTATVSPQTAGAPLYTITLGLHLQRTGTTPLKLDTPQVNVDGGLLNTSFDTSTNLVFKYDPAQADGNKLYLDTASNPTLITTAGASAGPLSSFDVNLGFTKVHVGGTADIGATINAQLQDPDGNGKISQTEWTTTAPQQEFNVGYATGASHANANLTLSSDITNTVGGSLSAASVTESDANLANGLDAPSVSLGDLAGFRNIQPQDFLSGLASLAVMIQSFEQSGPAAIDLPFLHRDSSAPPDTKPIEKLSDVVVLNQGLIKFFTDNGLSGVADPLTLNLDAAHLANVANVQDVLSKVEDALGPSAPALGLAYDPGTKQLTFTLGQTKHLATVDAHVSLGDQLKGVGLTNVNSAGLQAKVDPSYDWHLKFGVDLNPAPAGHLNDRLFVVPSATELTADVPITGTLDLAGQVGYLGLKLQSVTGGIPGNVPILARANPAKPMIDLKLKANAGDKVTLTQIFDAFGSSTSAANPFSVLDASSASDVVNAAVPPFDLQAAAAFNNGADVVNGVVHVAWPDISTGTPQLSADSAFNSQLLDFAYDPSNPAAMFTQLMSILGPVSQQLAAMVQNNPSLQKKLPLINQSFADLVGEFTQLSTTINDFASSPASFLQLFESMLEDKIAAAFNIDASQKSNLVTITLTPGSGSTGPTVNVQLSFGICTAPTGAPADPACTVSHPVHVPLSLSLPDVGGLVSVAGSGGVDITSKAVVKLGFGITLPTVAPALGGGDPTAAGAPQLFLATDPTKTAINVDVHAETSQDTTLQASVGPLTMTLGKTNIPPESGAQCDNATDDNGNGVVNDGCPQVGPTAEDPALGQCSDSIDSDSADADGKINDGCPTVQLPIEAKVGAKFHLSHDSGNITIDPANLADLTTWIGDLVPSSTDDFRPTDKATCTPFPTDAGTPSGPYDACAAVPVFVHPTDTTPAGNITFVAQNVFDPSTWHGQVDSSITSAILGQPLDWTTIVKGLHTVTHNLQAALDSSTYGGASIPVIGHSLDAGAQIVDKLNTNFVDPMNDIATALSSAGTFSDVQSTIQSGIWNHLGGGSGGVGLVLPYDASLPDTTVASASDIKVTLECGSDLHVCGSIGSDTVSGITNAEVSLGIGGTISDAKFKFDSGFPGLRLTMDKDITASVKFRYDLTFGLSRSRGFYVRTDEPAGTNRTKELTVDASVHIPNDGTHGDIAFLRLDISNNNTDPNYHDLGLTLAADVKGGEVDTDGATKLSFSDLTASDPSNPADLAVTLEGGIHLNLKLVLSVQMPDSVGTLPGEGALPKLNSDFHVDWGFGSGFSLNGGLSGHVDALTVNFDNVQLDLGSFFNQFLGPIVHDIQKFTKPLQPVIDTAEAPIPGLSQLSELAGNGKLTFLDFFEHASGADLTMVHRLIDLINLINNFPSSSSLIDLGHFSLDSGAVMGPAPTGDNAGNLISSTGESASQNALTAGSVSNGDALSTAESQGGLSFPAFADTRQLFQLLVGKDVKLIEFDAGDLSASFGFDITIGPFPAGPIPVSIIIGGSASIEGHFAIGYSTRGIREAVKSLTDDNPANDGFFQNASLLLDGIFIDDLNAQGVDVPEIRLTAEVHAGAEVDVVIASVGIEVGIQAQVDLNLHDGGRPTDPAKVDGLLYMDEIASMLNNPICIFDVSGELDAFVKFFLDIGISPFDVSFEITLVQVQLLNMTDITDSICNHPPPPHLAQEDNASGTLILKMGPNTPGRNIADGGPGGDLQTNEKFIVRQLDNNPGDAHSFSVTAFGLTQNYPEAGQPLIKRIFASGGNGNDTITMQPGVSAQNTSGGGVSTQAYDVTVPVELCGGSGNDVIEGGDNSDVIVGDGPDAAPGAIHCPSPSGEAGTDGNDTLGGGPGADTIYGSGGSDTIVGEAGNDTINAGSGDDNVQGGDGSDTINGNDGNDSLTGGPEVDPLSAANVHNCNDSDPSTPCITNADVTDTINGGNGADNISGDAGPDILSGGDGNDSIIGGAGDDQIQGNTGDDVITAGDGNDTVSGGDGNDQIFGQNGNDTLNGDAGDDSIVGSLGNDTVDGGPGADWILGDDGTLDRTKAPTAGGITLSGTDATAGNDTLSGGDGADIVYGQGGDDTINGGDGNDELHGNAGADVMNGDAGDDTMFGDAGPDTMNGGDGIDLMRGGTENDTMNGNAGDDTMFGDAGSDTMHGNDGVDHMRGGTEVDLMYGDAGDDVMNGDAGNDTMYGNDGNDSMHGDAGDDYMEGNNGADTMTGDAGQDDMIGGSSAAGQPDLGDTMCGGDCITPDLANDHDVMVGDNGAITRPGGDRVDGAHVRNVVLFDLQSADTSLYGNDTISGDQGDDSIYGGGGNDTLHGNAGDDYIEGNPGNDAIYGDAGQDDLIGGTSQGGGGVPDGNDCIQGDERSNDCGLSGSGSGSTVAGTTGGTAGGDVMIGDNGAIARTANAAGTDWVRDDFGFGGDGIVRRTVSLYDVATTTSTPAAGTSGDDYLYGDAGRDVLYGQGGNDVIHGGAGDDYAEGNAGGDQIFGDDGNDDLVGGSKEANRLDTGDVISGGAGFDVIAGDNAVLARVLDATGHWVKNTYDDGIAHQPRVLNDIDSTSSSIVSGNDFITGGTENDLIYGQGGNDTIQGNEGDDFIEGNAGADQIHGNDGQDDIIGGTVQAGVSDGVDTISGDGSADVVTGDNAAITRPLNATGQWIHDNRSHSAASDIVRRAVTLYDVATTTSTPAANTSDGDTIDGGDGADQLFGQGGNDTITGGNDDDYIEGNAGNDTISGNAGRDDLIGGGSAINGIISPTSVGDGLVDGNDSIHGNESGDAIAGDNARITRLPAAPAAAAASLWQTDVNTALDPTGDRDPIRLVQLFDLDKVGSTPPSPSTYGADNLSGDDGRDIIAGQGGDDTMSGGDGVDYLTGNSGNDTMTGDAGQDDMIGGSSAGNGLIADVLPVALRPAYSTPRDLRDGNDAIQGNDGDDAMVGDNASIARPERVAGSGVWWQLTNANFDLARRIVTMEKTPEAAGAYGDDTMSGGAGNDDMYGQLGNDLLNGDAGEDAMLGDLGQITNNLIGADDGLSDPGSQQQIAPNAPFFDPGETIFPTGSLYRQVELYSFDSSLPNVGSGNDTMFGGDGHDSMHGGPGADVMDGNAGDDYMFADDSTLVTFPLATYSPVGADAMWGGPGHDTMYGGHGVDYIDVLPRPSFVDKKGTFPRDPQAWFDAASTDPVQLNGHAGAYSGLDIMYGGWDQDWMQLDVSGPGPPPGDRALDWNGGFNAYYRCDASYGDWGITRQHSPSMQAFLQQLAFGMGAVGTSTPGTSGYNETAMVFPGDQGNANPVNPDNPAHFTCGVPHS
jgi:Ca2+-binding RTX toxin-like protein